LLLPGRIPGLRFVQDGLSAINPGALAASVYRQLTRRPEARVFDWFAAPSAAARRFGKWQMLFWSQTTAVGLNVGVLGTAAVLITFTDLAFGWSTTLSVDSGTAARVVDAIAAPWSGVLPQAVPDAALVERSQFFRLEGGAGLADSRALTGWWSFTVLAVIVYGLLPRLAFWLVAGWRLRAATRGMLLHDARVVALLDRMSSPDVATSELHHEEAHAASQRKARGLAGTALTGAAGAVVWGQAIATDAAAEYVQAHLGLAPGEIFEAGSGSLDADRTIAERLAGKAEAVVILVPAWEPPLLEFADFLALVRSAIGPSRSIVVVPVADAGREVTAAERENWRLAVGRTKDTHAYVEVGD
jgi:hypothetical protein